MVRHAARVGFGFTILFLAGITAFAQPVQRQLSVGPDAGDEEAVVRQVVDRIMRPYLGQNSIPGAIVADFTSGLPDNPTNLPRRLEKRSIEHYTTHDFLTWISHWRPATRLPAPYRYSNAGIGLLSYLVTTATGTPWGNQLNDEILQPLSMHNTTLRPSREQMDRMAQGRRRDGNDAPRWPVFAWYAAGGLRSTARDMLSFGEANLGHKEVNGKPISDELIAAMQLSQKPIYIMPNGINEQAMAWVQNTGNWNPNLHPVIVKNGGTAGFGSVIVINPSKDLAVFIAVNQAGPNPAGRGIEIVRHVHFR
jgi:CubicO group peptidase (beta-lactamase class C family)